MAFGFPPGYSATYPLQDKSPATILALVHHAIVHLGWEVTHVNSFGINALTGVSRITTREEIRISLQEDTLKLDSQSIGSQVYDMNRNRNNIRALITELESILYHSDSELINQIQQEFTDTLTKENPENEPLASPASARKNPVHLFKPTREFAITPVLLILNILLFVLMAISGVNVLAPDNESLLFWGANYRPQTLEGEWWRLMSSVFVHIGVFHLLMNMYALLYIGLLLEPLLGKTRFLSAYLMTGLLASLNSLWWHPMTISAGASGAIFGMYGLFLALLTTRLIDSSSRNSLLTSIVIFVGYNLMSGLKDGIDNAAHLGGLISGVVIGYAYYPSLKKPELKRLKTFSILGLLAVSILVTLLIFNRIPNVFATYEASMNRFFTNEATAVEVFQLPEDTPRDTLLYKLKYKGLDLWKENIGILHETEKLDLPEEIQNRNTVLLRYCNLRIQSYQLIYKTIETDSDQYQDSLRLYNGQIEKIIDSLNNR